MNKGILFLGTAGDHIVYGKQLRASAGILIVTEENVLHLNPGPGTLQQYKQFSINPREITTILLSSQQVIDANDVNAVIESMTLNGMDKKGVLISYNAPYELVTEYHKSLVERTIKLEQGMRVAINDLEIKSTHSTNEASAGFVLYTPEYVIGFTGNTSYREILVSNFKDCNILIVNCRNPAGIEENNYFNIDDAKKLIKEAKPNLAILTFFGQKMLATDILDEARNVQKETGIQTISATDGLFINPKQYSKGFHQQSLTRF
jgi:ribonuclease BN (tRNA processing enzyme)